MVHARRLALLLGTLALVGGVVSTGGYSAVSAERDAAVNVVSDERSFLGVEIHDGTLHAETNDDAPLVTLENRVGVPLTDVEVTVTDVPSRMAVGSTDGPSSLGIGGPTTVTASVVCGGSQSGTLTLQIHASGQSVSATIERSVWIDCELPVEEGKRRGRRRG